jgi:hypothetical protein
MFIPNLIQHALRERENMAKNMSPKLIEMMMAAK